MVSQWGQSRRPTPFTGHNGWREETDSQVWMNVEQPTECQDITTEQPVYLILRVDSLDQVAVLFEEEVLECRAKKLEPFNRQVLANLPPHHRRNSTLGRRSGENRFKTGPFWAKIRLNAFSFFRLLCFYSLLQLFHFTDSPSGFLTLRNSALLGGKLSQTERRLVSCMVYFRKLLPFSTTFSFLSQNYSFVTHLNWRCYFPKFHVGLKAVDCIFNFNFFKDCQDKQWARFWKINRRTIWEFARFVMKSSGTRCSRPAPIWPAAIIARRSG